MRKYSTKKALIASALTLALCFSMLLGTTFAWFTDSAASANNVIKAGNLDIAMHWVDGTMAVPAADSTEWTDASAGAIFDYDNWEPGYTQVRHIKIENIGTLALKYTVRVQANGTVSDLSDAIDVYYADPAIQIASGTDLDKASKLGTLTQVLEGLAETGNGTLVAGAADTVTLAFKMRETAGNEYMNKSLGTDFSIQVIATQLASEEDSFDNQYDSGATYPDITTKTIGDGETLTAGNVSVTLYDGAEKYEYTLKVNRQKVETDSNRETTVSLDIELLKGGDKANAKEGYEYGVAIDIGTGRVLTGITHSGIAINDYNYNPTTGIVTFSTESFSPFTVSYSENVIRINSADELIAALTEIKTEAKKQIPGAEGNKKYRENAIFVLENDIVIDSSENFMYTDSNGAPLHFYGVKGVLDLNGHSITVTSNALLNGKSHANAVILVQYSNIDIIGEGSIIAENKSIPVYAWANGSVNIYGGNYVTNASERNESAVYVNNATIVVNVYGGTFTNSAYAFNVHDNCGSTPVIVIHEGITYADFFKQSTDLTAADIAKGRIVLADGCTLAEYDENGVAMNKVVAE